MSGLEIHPDDLKGTQIEALLQAHLDLMHSTSPPESTHALDLEELRQADITFWSAHSDGILVGCVALKTINTTEGEIKSMHVASNQRGRGIAEALLRHLERSAVQMGLKRLSLETGSADAFSAAHRLYSRFSYQECPPFGDYGLDPHSLFMTKELTC